MFELKRVSVEKNGKKIIENATFKLEYSGLVWLKGASGSGKSTILRIMCALEKPSSGEIFYKGVSIYEFDIPEFRSKCIYVPQMPILGQMNVMDCIRLPFSFKSNANKIFDDKKLNDLLEYFELQDAAEKNINQLSGGEKLRIAIIRALLLEPECLLLDEPTSALDAKMEQKTLQLLKSLSEKKLIVSSFHTESIKEFYTQKIEIKDHYAIAS
ncbi:ABC transporter ATP-binding protein [Desulfurella sp.]|uniref:ABC transporter ATP-binding protein n=1 Tax=Desulfurella sp. TaxID=1962857 RepID=UPI003D0E6A6E